MPRHRIRDPRDPAEPERRSADAEPPPRLPGGRGELTPERVLALQRAGGGNQAIARTLARAKGDEEDEAEGDGGGGAPLLLTDRPWAEMFPPPLPVQPTFDFNLPILIPRESIPPEWRWLFDPQAPPPKTAASAPLMIEYKPTVPEAPEEDEAEGEEVPASPPLPVVGPPATEAPKKRRKRKKAKPAGEAQAQATAPPAPAKAQTPAPPPKPAEPDRGTMNVEDLDAWINAPSEGAKGKKGKKGAAQKPQMSRAERLKKERREQHEREQAERRQAKLEESDRLDKLAAERQRAADLEEIQLRSGLVAKLGAQKKALVAARGALPQTDDYAEIDAEAEEGIKSLTAYLGKAGKTDGSVALTAKSAEVASLTKRVQNFRPPLTPEQIREKVFNEAVVNVPLCFEQNAWEGRMGPLTSFQVDKHDDVLFNKIRTHFGRDTKVIPCHASKQYPGKTATSEVRYYVTATSHTPYIAYDISAHVWDHGQLGDTVHVLHIAHRG